MKSLYLQLLNNSTVTLLFRYGVVGVTASIVHFSIAYGFNEGLQFSPQIAHFLGFICGLFTAYFGHYFYSFNDDENHKKRFWKFFIISFSAFVIHQSGVYVLTQYFHLNYSTQVLPILITTVPVFTFLFTRFWVFSHTK